MSEQHRLKVVPNGIYLDFANLEKAHSNHIRMCAYLYSPNDRPMPAVWLMQILLAMPPCFHNAYYVVKCRDIVLYFDMSFKFREKFAVLEGKVMILPL